MDRIENLSDQLEGYSEGIESLVRKFNEKGYTKKETIEIIKLGEIAQFVDVFHHLDEDLINLNQLIYDFVGQKEKRSN